MKDTLIPFITFEGIDGSGKTTQAKLLCDKFRKEGRRAVFLFEPGSSILGNDIREILFNKKLFLHKVDKRVNSLLFLTEHIQNQEDNIKKYLAEGVAVVQDRSFIDSCGVYSKDDLILKYHDQIHFDCILPHVTVIINIDPEVAFNRSLRRNDQKFQSKPWSDLTKYKEMADAYLRLASSDKRFVVVEYDENVDKESFNQNIYTTIKQKLEEQ